MTLRLSFLAGALIAAVLGSSAGASPHTGSFLQAKLAVDRQIDPSIDVKRVEAEIDQLTKATAQLAGPNAEAPRTLDALRTVLYVAGPWNENRPFDYDHDDAHFKAIKTTLLSNYLKTRLGNCVSMPILFLILADRLGLNVELTRLPHHLLVRYTRPDGQAFYLEPTSGGHAQRMAWLLFLMPVNQEALANGVYLSSLTRQQTMAEMKDTLMEWLAQQGRYADIVPIADELIKADPRNAPALKWRGAAYDSLIEAEFGTRYASPAPYQLEPRFSFLVQHRDADMLSARLLGWRSDEELPANMDAWKLPVNEIRRRCPGC